MKIKKMKITLMNYLLKFTKYENFKKYKIK